MSRCKTPIAFAMKTNRIIRFVASPFLPLLVAGSAMAGSFIGFETVGPNPATDSMVLAEQFRPTMGIRFSRADGGSVILAKSGVPATAFAAGPDTAVWAAGDSLLVTDPWATSVGNFFVKLSGAPASALVIDYDDPTAAAGGLILDVDADETWAIRAYSDNGATLVAETVLAGGSAGTGDQTATPWAVTRPSADIVQLRIVQTGTNANAGAALDLFSPYGPFDSSDRALTLKFQGGPSPAVGLQPFQPVFQCDPESGRRGIFARWLHLVFAASSSLNHTGKCALRPSTEISRAVITPRLRPSIRACSTMSREVDSAAARSAMLRRGRVTSNPCRGSTSFSSRFERCSTSTFGVLAVRRNAAGTVMWSLAGFRSESSWMLSAVWCE